MVTPQEVLDVLSHPQALHAALVHAPVVLAMIGALLCMLVLATRGRHAWLRNGACICLALVLVSALGAARAGQSAFGLMGDVSLAARETAAMHRWMGERVWILALLALGAALLARSTRPRAAMIGRIGAAAASGTLGAWVILTAHHGGTLVYKHGVGVPQPIAVQPTQTPEALPNDPRVVFFASEVRPLLTGKCMGCHGPDAYAASALSLTSPAGFLKGGTRGPAVVPGSPEMSLLIHAVRAENMPRMPFNQPALTNDQIEILKRWIREGAVWR